MQNKATRKGAVTNKGNVHAKPRIKVMSKVNRYCGNLTYVRVNGNHDGPYNVNLGHRIVGLRLHKDRSCAILLTHTNLANSSVLLHACVTAVLGITL